MSSREISEKLALWDREVYQTWGSGYPAALSDFLLSRGVRDILDCAGGTGFPAIDLKRLGWDISYADGLRESVEYFDAKRNGLDIPTYWSKWSELPKKIPKTFGAVLCRGNSLSSNIEFDGEQADVGATRELLLRDLRGMCSVLVPRGMLFVDVLSVERARPPIPIRHLELDPTSGEAIEVVVKFDASRGVRQTEYRSPDGRLMWRFESIPLISSELVQLLREAGFVSIVRAPTPEPQHIEAWVAVKP